MHADLPGEDRLVLDAFLACHIPPLIREATIGGLDLMEHYEELFNYSLCLSEHGWVNTRHNSLGTGESFALGNEFRGCLSELIAESKDHEVILFACLSLCAIEVVKKYGAVNAGGG